MDQIAVDCCAVYCW